MLPHVEPWKGELLGSRLGQAAVVNVRWHLWFPFGTKQDAWGALTDGVFKWVFINKLQHGLWSYCPCLLSTNTCPPTDCKCNVLNLKFTWLSYQLWVETIFRSRGYLSKMNTWILKHHMHVIFIITVGTRVWHIIIAKTGCNSRWHLAYSVTSVTWFFFSVHLDWWIYFLSNWRTLFQRGSNFCNTFPNLSLHSSPFYLGWLRFMFPSSKSAS